MYRLIIKSVKNGIFVSIEYNRWQVEKARKALKNRRVVAVLGARQTGKTTLTKQITEGNDGIFRSLDKSELLKSAKDDPSEFVKNPSNSETMVIDEIQKAPALTSEIKILVDKNNRPGQYLITGSSNIQTVAVIDDSLAGRIKHIRLRPLAIGEILGKKPTFLQKVFSNNFQIQIKGFDKSTIFDLAFRGGYPEALRFDDIKERKDWHKDYIDSLLKKDLQYLENIRRIDVLQDLVKILASWSGKYMDKAKIRSSLEISKTTLSSYINALEALFIFEKVAPWLKTDYDIVGKRPKFFVTDTGLMTSILNWKKDEVMIDYDRAGKLMETFVFQELSAQIDLDSNYSLYQYRDSKNREIDFLIERGDDETLVGIKVKA
jgi:predicted AAA+ superfamily ATPase